MTATLNYININGKVLEASKAGLSIHNRAYKFGDGIFDTIRVINGRPVFLEDHFSRLNKSMNTLKMKTPDGWSLYFYRKEISKVLTQNEIARGARVRATFFRKPGGLYAPSNNDVAYSIEVSGIEENAFMLNESGLQLGIWDEIPIHPNILSPLKTINCLPYIMAGLYVKESGFDDVIIKNTQGALVEAISSNLFVLSDGILYTPPVKDGCIAGVMRKKVIQLSKKRNLPVIETSISGEFLEKAEEIFLTNAISGIQWVGAFKKTRYFHKLAESLIQQLNEITQS